MKRLLMMILCLLLMLPALPASAETMESPSLTERIFILFGADEAAALDVLGSPEIVGTEERGAQRTLLLGGEDAPVRLTFYNDVLMACEYSFGSHESAFGFAKACMNDLTAALGGKTTYPNVTADFRGYLSELSEAAQIEEMFTYYEDWTCAPDEEIILKMTGGADYSRVDLRLELSAYPSDTAVVSMKYMVVRSGLQ